MEIPQVFIKNHIAFVKSSLIHSAKKKKLQKLRSHEELLIIFLSSFVFLELKNNNNEVVRKIANINEIIGKLIEATDRSSKKNLIKYFLQNIRMRKSFSQDFLIEVTTMSLKNILPVYDSNQQCY